MEWGRICQWMGVCLLISGFNLARPEASAADESRDEPLYDDVCGSLPQCCSHCAPSWTPILCCDLDEDWCAPYVASPNGCSGAPRQGWLATPDGFLTKEFHLFYGLTNNNGDSTDVHTGMFQLQYPLSRRVWVGIDVPFSGMVDRGPGLPDLIDFDDLTVTGKILLHETRNLGLTAELGVRTPTGDSDMGGGIAALTPACNWWSDVGGGWSCRGGVGVDVGTSGVPGNNSTTDLLYALALGQTVTPHDDTPWGDFTYYVSLHGRSGLDGPDPRSFFYVGPGLRTHLGNNLFFLTAIQVPVSGPNSFDQQLMFMFVKGL
jgi:Putative MetA-pathway of phenol degradation